MPRFGGWGSHGRRAAVAAAAALVACLLTSVAASGATAATCDRVASTTGSDNALGTPAAPYRTFQRLANSLQPGQTGCLRAGIYHQDVKIRRGGTEDAPLTIRSYPGERAKLLGRLWIAHGANHVTISLLDLDGRNADDLPSPTVTARYTTFTANNITNVNTEICFVLGSNSYGRAVRTVIAFNRIHNCGERPATNMDHGIYVEHSTGARIVNNLIYDNADRGIQLYPDAQQTYIAYNVIDGNGTGVQFSGDSGLASSDNLVESNLITNSRIYNVASWYPDGNPIGRRNVVRSNCLFGGGEGQTNKSQVGYRFTSSNIIADPQYVNRTAKDFRLRDGSPCLQVL